MSDLIIAPVSNVMEQLVEKIEERFGEEENTSPDTAIEELVLTGAVKVKGQWFNFGASSRVTGGLTTTNAFVLEGEDTFANALQTTFDEYTRAAAEVVVKVETDE